MNSTILEPLFAAWEEPVRHRVRGDGPGAPAKIVNIRRPSPVAIAQNLRMAVHDWREAFYAGASGTTRTLLTHWFGRSHRRAMPSGEEYEFRYYFCQREAIETLIYLKEVRRIERLSQLVAEFQGENAEIAALGIAEDEDAWGRYAFKLATGAGKTKVMSLAMVWSYFHALYEPDSEMARHFVVIAPNLTVYERLREDFAPPQGGPDIFRADPLIPPEWTKDWNLSVVLQDEAGGAATGGTLYLTNIHRLFDPGKRRGKQAGEAFDWMGPTVSKASALDTGEALRERITAHQRVMVLNDEAHHVWDPDSAWNEAITYLHETILKRNGRGLTAQLDFSATPKDNKGQMFKHVVCDTPLGEAVDAGIVKTPVIGQAEGGLAEAASDDAAYRFERHLRLGYERWKKSCEEWRASGKRPLLFVMCEDTEAADQIARRLNGDASFKELNGKTINLHTNLKGKIKKMGSGPGARQEFVENDKDISEDDLKELRKLSRELDANHSPYQCIVSVLMLREGWDVRNVTTIVPLRPYSSKAQILPEQTLGRGLRRMTPCGQAHEVVTVVEHPAFASLYKEQLAQEGLNVEIVNVQQVPKTTVSIFPDRASKEKDLAVLEIILPALAPGHRMLPSLEDLGIEDVRREFAKYKKLPLGKPGPSEINYEGRLLFTGEVVEKMRINLPLLGTGFGAVSYYVRQLESICKLNGLNKVVAPLLETFLTEILFEESAALSDDRLVSRLANADVGEHVRAVFVPLIRKRTTQSRERLPVGESVKLSQWAPFQVTHSERRRVIRAKRTLFNLVPCNRELEVGFAEFANRAKDGAAFAKNAGPQCLRIDYLAAGGRLAFYTPDFFVRLNDGNCLLVETKGQEDVDVPRKARAALAWCEAASQDGGAWEYLYVPEGVFAQMTGDTMAELARVCAPALHQLVESEEEKEKAPLFAWAAKEAVKAAESVAPTTVVEEEVLASLPPRYQEAARQAIMLHEFLAGKPGMNFAPVFTALLGSVDDAANGLIQRQLGSEIPPRTQEQKAWFDCYFEGLHPKNRKYYENMAQNLKRTLVFQNGISPLGLLRSCFEYASHDDDKLGGVFDHVRRNFRDPGARLMAADDPYVRTHGCLGEWKAVYDAVQAMNDFRNTYVAHQENEIRDAGTARQNLKLWIDGLALIYGT